MGAGFSRNINGAKGVSFSPDGRHYAYTAARDDKWCAVVDGKEGKKYDILGGSLVTFGPDGRHFAYMAGAEGKQFLVVDSSESKPYIEFLRGTRIVFDDSAHLHTLVRRDDEQFQSEHFRIELEIRP